MKLSRISISGSRTFSRDVDLTLSDGLNVLVGPNNCGKSTLIHAARFALDPEAPPPPQLVPSDGIAPVVRCEFDIRDGGPPATAISAIARYLDTVEGADPSNVNPLSVAVSTNDERKLYGFGPGSPVEEKGDPELRRAALGALADAIGVISVSAMSSLADVLSEGLRVLVSGDGQGELAVVRERLNKLHQEYKQNLEKLLFDAVESDLVSVIQDLFPEVAAVEFEPQIKRLLDLVSSPRIDVRDGNDVSLIETGSGLRVASAVAMAEHICRRSDRSVICLFEESEAFLHPGAQETLSGRLEKLALNERVSVLSTTESPFLLPRSDRGQVVSMMRIPTGQTIIRSATSGNRFRMESASELFSDAAFAGVFERVGRISDDALGIVVVEGWTDERYLRIAAERLGLDSKLDKLDVIPAGGAMKAALEAIVIRAETDRPMVVLLDADEHGRAARLTLTGRFEFRGDREVFLYSDLCPDAGPNAQAEDVFSSELIAAFVEEHGGDEVITGKSRGDGRWHYDIDQQFKGILPKWIETRAETRELDGWRTVLEKIFEFTGLDDE